MEQEPATKTFTLPIEWIEPEDLKSVFSNNVIVQHTSAEFLLSFYEIFPPILIGSPDDRMKKAEGIKSVKSRCVARVVLTPEKMRETIVALQENYKQFEDKTES